MRHLVCVVAVVWSGGCGAPPDDKNPIAGDRVAEGVLHFEGHDSLDNHAFVSSTPGANQSSAPNAAGDHVFQISILGDDASPTVSVSLAVADDAGVVGPGTYDVVVELPEEGSYATANVVAGSNDEPVFSVTGIGAEGTVTITTIADGRATGSWDIEGTASWTAGEGPFEFASDGTFSDVPVATL